MRCVSFVLLILAVAVTSSVRGQQPEVREALRDAARDAAIENRGPISDARREVRQTRRDERQESLSDSDSDLRTQVREALRDALRDAAIENRGPISDARREVRQTRRDERQESLSDSDSDLRTQVREALRMRFATRRLKIGGRSAMHAARCARPVGTSGKSRSATAIRICGLRFVRRSLRG